MLGCRVKGLSPAGPVDPEGPACERLQRQRESQQPRHHCSFQPNCKRQRQCKLKQQPVVVLQRISTSIEKSMACLAFPPEYVDKLELPICNSRQVCKRHKSGSCILADHGFCNLLVHMTYPLCVNIQKK